MTTNPGLEDKADEVRRVLSGLANSRRLLILCHLLREGETPVSGLLEVSGLSQSALSQHLAMMRMEGLVRTRKQGQSVFYSIGDSRVTALMASLEAIFCPVEAN